MIVLAIIFLLSQIGSPAVGSDNVVMLESGKRLLVTHVVYFNDSGTPEDRESAKRALDGEVAKDIVNYQQHGLNVITESRTLSIAMATRLWQVDHLEIQPPPLKPRD